MINNIFFLLFCEINDNFHYPCFCHNSNPSCMKRHFLPFFGHLTNIRLTFLNMRGNCKPADNTIPIEIQSEYAYSLHSKSRTAVNTNINFNLKCRYFLCAPFLFILIYLFIFRNRIFCQVKLKKDSVPPF